VTFNAEVVKGSSGFITVVRAADGIAFETIPIGDPRITVAGAQVIINLNGTLRPRTSYDVLIDGACLRSTSGALFPGIGVRGEWRFRTIGRRRLISRPTRRP
jgi:hypothetical protein